MSRKRAQPRLPYDTNEGDNHGDQGQGRRDARKRRLRAEGRCAQPGGCRTRAFARRRGGRGDEAALARAAERAQGAARGVRSMTTHSLMTGISFGESPRWHDDRLWFCDWGTQQLIAVDAAGASEVVLTL